MFWRHIDSNSKKKAFLCSSWRALWVIRHLLTVMKTPLRVSRLSNTSILLHHVIMWKVIYVECYFRTRSSARIMAPNKCSLYITLMMVTSIFLISSNCFIKATRLSMPHYRTQLLAVCNNALQPQLNSQYSTKSHSLLPKWKPSSLRHHKGLLIEPCYVLPGNTWETHGCLSHRLYFLILMARLHFVTSCIVN